jgi:hypothetical protein
MLSRRNLLSLALSSSFMMSVPIFAGCSHRPKPVPFQTGEKIMPPKGCVDLRQANAQADC